MKVRLLMAPTAAACAAMFAALTVFACTTVQGTTSVSPTTVAPGGSISATGSGALNSHTYSLFFLDMQSWQDSMGTCMGSGSHKEVNIGGPTTSNGSGALASTPGTIPSNAGASTTALVCWIDSGAANATNDAMITVT